MVLRLLFSEKCGETDIKHTDNYRYLLGGVFWLFIWQNRTVDTLVKIFNVLFFQKDEKPFFTNEMVKSGINGQYFVSLPGIFLWLRSALQLHMAETFSDKSTKDNAFAIKVLNRIVSKTQKINNDT